MTCYETCACPNCESGTYVRKMVGTSMEFLSNQPGDALIKEAYKTVLTCDENNDAPRLSMVLTDCRTGDERQINHYL